MVISFCEVVNWKVFMTAHNDKVRRSNFLLYNHILLYFNHVLIVMWLLVFCVSSSQWYVFDCNSHWLFFFNCTMITAFILCRSESQDFS